MGLFDKIDHAMLGFAPARAVRRMQARQAGKALMNYDAASRGPRTYGWKAPKGSADYAAAGGTRERLRGLSRDMIRNRPFARRAMDVVTNNVVGSGVRPSIGCTDAETKAAAERVVKSHLMTPAIDAQGLHSLPQLQRIAMNAVFSDGECFARRRKRRAKYASGLDLPFQVELVEADYLDVARTSNGDNDVIDGVEYGPTGTIVAYWFYDQHPDDTRWKTRRTSRRWAADDVIALYRADRIGQTRGVPWLAPVVLTLGDLADYNEAQIIKQKMSALMAAFIEDTNPTIGAKDMGTAASGFEDLAPGAVVSLPAGKTVKFTDPPAVDGFDMFNRQGLSAIAMGIGITYEALAGDLSGVNFSSARMGRMEMDKNIEVWQQHLIIDQLCRGIGRWFQEAWILDRSLPQEVPFTMEWTAPRRALVDPTREIPALLKAVEGGVTSLQRATRQLGEDPEQILNEQIEDQVRWEPLKEKQAAPPPDRPQQPKPKPKEPS